ncbi:MAG: tripartite tricarboxylate transporter substrate binding protein [Betaproteobacteria bacterium]
MDCARHRRRLFTVLLLPLLLVMASVHAQGFPSKPIELVVHTSPGGGTDIFARFIADLLTREKLVTQPVNVLNRVGGGGAIAYTYIKSKRGDPHTVMTVATLALLTNSLRPELELGMENFTPLVMLAQDPQAVMVQAESPHRTFKDFVEAARREPGSIVASVTSPGGSGRLLVWLLERETGARFKSVSFKSGGDAILQVMGGHTHFTTENVSEGYSAVEGKKLRVLAVSSAKRLPIVPDVPTLRELGYNIHIGTGRGFAMPAGVPKEAAAQMESLFERIHKSAAWKDYAEKNMFEDLYLGSAEYAKHLAQRRVVHQEFLKAVGIIK